MPGVSFTAEKATMLATLLSRARELLTVTILAATLLSATAAPGIAVPTESVAHNPGHVDVLFIGAHPDDEVADLSTFGQWHQNFDVKVGVVTVTRGEGGGNAAGPEEGPTLGLLREGEERGAVALAGIHDVHYLDKVDFYYTTSAPLTQSVWGGGDTLARLVRIIRETTPKIIITMGPAPVPGQHGNHQEVGRLATEAYFDAADSTAFASQITDEHLAAWRASRLLKQSAAGAGPTGPTCSTGFTPTDPTQNVYGVWTGAPAPAGQTWAQVAIRAAHMYLTQGFNTIPDPPSDPRLLGCAYYTLIDSRAPFTVGNRAPDAILEGALEPTTGGLPAGTEFFLTESSPITEAGQSFVVTAQASTSVGAHARARLRLPSGWTAIGDGELDQRHQTRWRVTVPANAAAGANDRVTATLITSQGTGQTSRSITVRAPVTAAAPQRPDVADYIRWTSKAGVPQLRDAVTSVQSLDAGGSVEYTVQVHNGGAATESGTVTLNLPVGFAAMPSQTSYAGLPPGGTTRVRFVVSNTDPTLATSDQGPDRGDYKFTIATTSSTGGTDLSTAALELVPTTVIPHVATPPTVDGTEEPGEYPGPELDISRLWEGAPCSSAADCSGFAKISWSGDALYVLVHVNDNVLGAELSASDCKRHWRTDSVEIDIDPRGNSADTSTTFKTGILPVTTDPGHQPCFERDADNHQGPGALTAPGMIVASKVSSPYTGYTIETKIPMADLPSAVDPRHMGLNVLAYDSDTQDKIGKSRIAWSPFGGVQGDPYRWGRASLPGYTPPAGRATTPKPPVLPEDPTLSATSPHTIEQSIDTGIPLAGGPAAVAWDTARLVAVATPSGTSRVLVESTGAGTAYVTVVDGDGRVLQARRIPVHGPGRQNVDVPVGSATVLLGFVAAAGGTATSCVVLTR
jgi:LmbE family N-acetylglucosaminyl deacetylase